MADTLAEVIAKIKAELLAQEILGEFVLPEDTCVAEIISSYYEDDPSKRICMKPREDARHSKCTLQFCDLPHHAFVMGSRPKKKIQCMSDMWE